MSQAELLLHLEGMARPRLVEVICDLSQGQRALGYFKVDPQAYLADVLSRLANRHPASRIDQLMPWAYANQVA